MLQKRILEWILLSILLNVTRSQSSNPLKDPNICGFASCELDNEKFRYSQNVIYKYAYESSFKTLFEGTDNNDPESELYISALAEVIFPTKCQGLLRLTKVQLKNQHSEGFEELAKPKTADYEYDDDNQQQEEFAEDKPRKENVVHPRSEYFSREIEGKDMKFDFRDGLIQEICPRNDESIWVTNFKRGILSAFQNTMFRFDLDHKTVETDVSGKCEVSYKFIGSAATSIFIVKEKDVASCQNRAKFKSAVQTTPYDFRKSDISWWPIYNSTSACSIYIDNYAIKEVECKEKIILIPFSNGENGAASKTTMKLKFLSTESYEVPQEDNMIESRKSMLYDHSFSPKPTHNEIKISREYLKQMCKLGFPNIQRDFPDKFVKFLEASKQLTSNGLQQLLARSAGICANGRKHIIESLPFIGSVASVELMKDLITGVIRSTELTPEVEEIWMNSIFYLPRPEESTITSMFSLMQHYEANLNPIFILIPSAVVHTFCKSNDCRNYAIVMNSVKYLEEKATDRLRGDLNDKKTHKNLMVALKGLGNIGIISKKFENDLKDLIIDEYQKNDVKLQAIEVFRKTDCDKTRDFFADIYQNTTQSVEIRIASYLQFMKCPNYLNIKQLKSFLLREPVNQVGSFVWSHLTNLAKTSSPQKVEMQGLLADLMLDEKFNMDFRKFSKNYEYSLFFDEYNFGLSGESNVIFGTSYLPRSVSFNGTINLFGNSVNPLEFNIRIQGMEKYIESIFGIEGPLNFDRLVDKFGFILEKFRSMFSFDYEIIETILRSRRSSRDASSIGKKFPYTQDYDFKKPTGYFEHKIFGNDVSFYPFDGFDELSELIKKLVPVDRMQNVFSKKEELFIKSGTLVDVAYSLPTSNGFPLVLNGFGAYSLDMSYLADLKNDFWKTGSLDFIGKMKPSLSMEMNIKMQIDLFHASTDIKVKSNIYSNYAFETDVKLKGNTYASISFKLPQDRNDIFSVRSQLTSQIDGRETSLYGITNRYMNSTCTWPSIDTMVGLKLCIDYSLPDVSDTEKIYPSLVLSGPVVFDIHLDKADLSAKVFNFEYKWDRGIESSNGSITFETPNTKIPRQFAASLLSTRQEYNLSMGFVNGDQKQNALGYIKMSPAEKLAELTLNLNNNQYFSLSMSLMKKLISKNRSSMTPTFLLVINDQRVAGMNGIIKTIDKNNVTQHDIDLTFETKKMKSSAGGHVVLTGTSLRSDMTYTYKFSGKKEETIEINTEMADRSQKMRDRTEYTGSIKFLSSAYKHYNFVTSSTFIRSLGHVETRVDINNAPDLVDPSYTLSTKVTFAKNTEEDNKSRTMFAIEMNRPQSNIDVKFHVKYDKNFKDGTEHNVLMLIRYSTNKEIVSTTSVLFPQGALFMVDASSVLTIPDINSCSATVKIKELTRKKYYVDVAGEWFTGENIKFVGVYQDRTSNIKRYYKLKSVVSSKLFDDINLTMKYSRDVQEMKVKIQTEYKKKNYLLIVESSQIDESDSLLVMDLKWADLSYSFSANSSSKGIGTTKVEVHMDRIRDVHLDIWGTSQRFSKVFGIELKWDANRDPSQKFIVSYEFDKPHELVYTGNVLVSYPDRTLNGNLNISTVGPYTGNMKISWSADEAIDVEYSVGSEMDDYRKVWAMMRIDTPFKGWRNNMLNGTLYQKENLVAITIASNWAENQNIAINFDVDYFLGGNQLSGELKAEIQSTMTEVPIIKIKLKHNQTSEKVDSEVLFRHKNLIQEEYRVFSLKSAWKNSLDAKYRNVSGSIKFISPFENYKSGAMVTKFSASKDRHVYGVFDVDVDDRVHTFTIEGYHKRLLDNMIVFNLTTPIETFPYLFGKFGIQEPKRYLIADLKTINKSLGIEILSNFVSISDFDLKFSIATPQPAFEKVLAIGKIKEDTIHLEGAWNKITLGFIGVWHFLRSNNFEYSYIVLTPFPPFEENGLIFKFIAEDVENFDIETSLKLGKHKIGVKAMGEPRTQLINQLGLQKASYIRENLFSDDPEKDPEDLEKTKSDIVSRQYYGVIGNFEVCTILWSPISGNYEIQQVDRTYHALVKMTMPGGMVQVRNKFVAEPQNYVNRLVIDLPLKKIKSITSNGAFMMPEAKGLIARFDVGILDDVRLNTYGVHVHYDLPSHAELKIHDIAVVLLFPIMNSTKINLKARLELTKTFVHFGSINLDGFETQLEISGKASQNDKDLDLDFRLMLVSPIVEFFQFESYLKKRSLQNDNKILAGFEFKDMNDERKFDLDLGWRDNAKHVIDGDFAISSNVFPIQKFNTSVFISEGQEPVFKIQILFGKTLEQMSELKFNIAKVDSKFSGEIVTPFEEYSSLRFDGTIVELETPGSFKARGKVFKNLAAHDFDGEVTLYKNLPTKAVLNFRNLDDADTTLDYSLRIDDLKRSIRAEINKNRDFLSFESELYIANLLDWAYNVKVKSSKDDLKELMLSTTLTPLSKTQYESSFEMITPWPKHYIDQVNVSTILRTSATDGDFKILYEISNFVGSGGCSWKWLQKVLKQDYQVKVLVTKKDKSTLFSTEIGYSNSTRTPANLNFDVNVNSLWLLGSKATFDVRNVKDMSFDYELSIPEPIKNNHKFVGHYKASSFPLKFEPGVLADIHVGYASVDATSDIKVKGSMKSFKDITNSIVLEWGEKSATRLVNSNFKLQENDAKVNFDWELQTPYFEDENTVNLNANYQVQDAFKIVHATVNSPASRLITVGDVAFADLANMKGSINCTMPVFNVSWFDINFDLDSQDGVTGKFIKASWPENHALLDSKSSFIQQQGQKEWKGTIKTEVPLHTKHNVQIIYGLEEKPMITAGDASIEYNSKSIINSHYTCKTETISEKEMKDVINLILENEVRPIGVYYTHHKKLDKPKRHDFAKRHLEVFDLGKENRFNITGEFTIDTQGDTQNYELTAIHPNRTIAWTSQFKSVDKATFHSSRIELAKNVWLSYNVEVSNHTSIAAESQELKFKISYPDRELSVDGLYLLKSDSLDTDVKARWSKTKRTEERSSSEVAEEPEVEEKNVAAKFQWLDHESHTLGKDHQSVILSLKHPSFDKDVMLTGSYYRDGFNVTSLEIDFDYTEDEDHHAKFKSEIMNMTADVGYKNYTIEIFASHIASELNLAFDGSMGFQPKNYKIEASGSYKRGYLPEMELELIGFIDTDTKEVKFYRSTPNKRINIYATTMANFPRYTIDGVFVDTPEYESAGAFELDFNKKVIDANVNFTEDASQNLQVKGSIPDTRSASFKIWRNYDDVEIKDIVYFVQMNHSRLITSKLIWRPKMRKEVKETIKDFVTGRYNAMIEELDYWVKTFYTEIYDTVKGILSESQPYAQELLNDLAAVKDVDEDLVAFRNFLNESYNADDFYIQSFINYTMTVLDELAITDHIQTIPKIFKEMWEVLGESSMAFKNSTTWILNTIKTSYKESVEMFNNFMQGNSLEHITKFLEIIIEKYDRFVKDLHVTFMNYIETMWDNLTRAISVYWNRVLQNIEPQIIRSIHFLESILWGISTEIFDFMYNRTNELIESPYFSKVSNITHDLDVFYQDLSNNDLFTNVRKYSGVMWQFLKEKFLSMVPFGKELREISVDIANEFRELKKVEAVKEAVERYEDIVSKMNWVLSEFQFEKRLNALLDIIKHKLTRITQNALQTEDVYREAKTKFIFDPEKGKIEWEQKLPMAWHAFNETPQFEEIPEYKMLKDIQSFVFSKKNSSIWGFYYGWTSPLAEPQRFLPPFKSHALLVGSSHVITFDKNFVTFNKSNFTSSSTKVLDEGCSHLLAHDWIDNRFSFILKSTVASDKQQKFLAKTFVIQSGDNVIEIELGTTTGSIKVGKNSTSILPVQVDDLLVMQELNVITVSSRRGFTVWCNLEFDVCVIELSGWFFGKIAGVLGTMNNEPFDDLRKSDNTIAAGNDEFTDSWKLDSMCSSEIKEAPTAADKLGDDLKKICESFFRQKNSYFAECFPIVDPEPFYKMCLSLAAHPKFQLTSETSEKAACTSGMAYMETCSIENVPLRIPDNCVHCKLPNGNTITEGTYTNLTDNLIVPTVDVVFIMETGACNSDNYKKSLLNALVTSIANEFKQQSIDNQRFAVVTYGGVGPFSKPSSVTANGNVFANAQNVNTHFDHVKNESGNIDVFTAIASATKLVFQPGSVKIFVLSLCTKCKSNLFEFDSKSILQLLRDNDITLHLLHDNLFSVRKVIGVDSSKAFIRKDQSKLIGSEDLKSQVSPVKQLGQCGSLALDSKGSVFSSVNTNKKNDNDFKIIANVFAKRIAKDAKPKPCYSCECQGHNSGAAYMTCKSCGSQGLISSDYNIDEILKNDEDSYEDES